MMSENDFERLLDRYLQRTATEQEIRWVEKWYSSLDSENNYPALDETEEGILNRADLERIKKKISRREKIVPIWPLLAKSAAVILVGLTFIYLAINPSSAGKEEDEFIAFTQDEIINTSSGKKIITLPDSTQVSLQPNSLIRFSTVGFNNSDRRIDLEGGASFAVSHDEKHPFQVFTYDVITTVLGTSFTIEAPSDRQKITVAVHTGRVSVAQKKKPGIINTAADEIIVTPNQQAVFDPEKKELTAILVSHPVILIKPKSLRVIFDEEPIINILRDIQTVFAVKIEYDGQMLDNCRITTAFSDEGLYERLDILSKAIGASYSIEGTKIKFNGNRCVTNN